MNKLPLAVLFALLALLCGQSNAAAPAKNVLFIVSDDLRASVLGSYGDKERPKILIITQSARLLFSRLLHP
jgi:hypothetical protein